MKDKTTQEKFTGKRHKLEYSCQYRLTHFCDGTPNKSIDERATEKPPCPRYHTCEIRRDSIFD